MKVITKKQLEVITNRKGIAKEDRKPFIKSLHRKGWKYAHIAKFIGLSRQRIDQIMHPEKHLARQAAYKNLEPKACEHPKCGDTITAAHHPDYSKPLEVIWLCHKHHGMIHTTDENLRKREEIEQRRITPRTCITCDKPIKQTALFNAKHCKNKECLRERRKVWQGKYEKTRKYPVIPDELLNNNKVIKLSELSPEIVSNSP